MDYIGHVIAVMIYSMLRQKDTTVLTVENGKSQTKNMRTITTILLLLILSCPAYAEPIGEWSDTDKTLFTTAEVLLVVDCGQALDGKYHNSTDKNPIVNSASPDGVKAYFATCMLGLWWFCENFPQYRETTLALVNSLEIYVINDNAAMGYRINF